ncbi:hypothetical protein AAEX28_15170 [Lentisphaerota bacterium WC36G]|nr:hypothetical protein LJT99_01900 [Lentisphaerae bacterium WC36]UDQ98305.1 hypothetical protein LJT99_01930 [Lentisphaerae bacterium WC36]
MEKIFNKAVFEWTEPLIISRARQRTFKFWGVRIFSAIVFVIFQIVVFSVVGYLEEKLHYFLNAILLSLFTVIIFIVVIIRLYNSSSNIEVTNKKIHNYYEFNISFKKIVSVDFINDKNIKIMYLLLKNGVKYKIGIDDSIDVEELKAWFAERIS